MNQTKVRLAPLLADDRGQFITDNQWAFKYGAMIEFGLRDDHVDDDGEIISRDTIEHCLDEADTVAYRIFFDGRKVGGVVLKINKETHYHYLELLFILPEEHGKGIGQEVCQAVEALYPETKVWETCTPYFEKRNIHFYVNKCGFHIVEFYNEFHRDSNLPSNEDFPEDCPDELFRFVKVMK